MKKTETTQDITTPEQMEKLVSFLKTEGIDLHPTSLTGLYIQYDMSDECLHKRTEIVRLGVRRNKFCVHTVSSEWTYEQYEQESKIISRIFYGIKAIAPHLTY